MKKIYMLTIFIIACIASGCSTTGKSVDEKISLADSKATTETENLYRNLKKYTQKGIMFGHQDALAYGIGWKYEDGRSDVKSVTGDYPAVFGWEIGHIELGGEYSLDSVSFDKMRQFIKQAYEMDAINTISWHGDNPLTGGSTWDVSKTGVVKSILPGGENHNKFKSMLDNVASFFLSLKADDGKLIPVVFRPYHEHSGSWFWWGKNLCTAEEYKQLWHFTVNYLKDDKQVHNIIYAYSPDLIADKDEYFERYPGDEYVDILGADLYHRNGENGKDKYVENARRVLSIITEAASEKNKIAVFSETGSETIPMADWWTEVLGKTIADYKIAYVLVWRNAYERPDHYYAPYPGHPSENNFKKFYDDPKTLFQSDLKNTYK